MLRIVVPARLESTRLPAKMLQKIGGKTVVEHSAARVLAAAGARNVVLATDSPMIAVLVAPACQIIVNASPFRSGTDRVADVAAQLAFADEDIVVDVQADMPFINPAHLAKFFAAAEKGGEWDVLTAVCDHRVVRVRLDRFERAAVPCHVGLYAYKMPALRRFASLPSSTGEVEYGLEQLRAVDNGFKVGFHAVPDTPFEINTPEDLAAAQHIAECLS